jgi:protein TonB
VVDVIVLTDDTSLYESIRGSVDERKPVWRARNSEEAVDMLLLGRCGVLIVDLAAVSTQPASLVEQIHSQFPDAVVVVAGSREDEGALTRLVSDGLIYRYMHKPLSARRAGMFLSAAIRQYEERRGRRDFEPLLPLIRHLPERGDRKYWAIAAVVIVTVVLAVAFLPGNEPDPPTLLAPAATKPEPATPTPRADPVLSRARAALAAGRYEAPEGRNALDLYRAVLLAKPDHAEARLGLERTVDAIVAEAERQAAGGKLAEAERLVHRVLEAEPSQPAAQALLARLHPPAPPRVESVVATPAPETTAAVHDVEATPNDAASSANDSTTGSANSNRASSTESPNTDKALGTTAASATGPPSALAARGPSTPQSPELAATPAVAATATVQKKPIQDPMSAGAGSTRAAQPVQSAAASSRPHSSRPVPDPLQPTLAMQTPKQAKTRRRVFGAPISSGHAIAGIETRPYVADRPGPSGLSGTPRAAAADAMPIPVSAPAIPTPPTARTFDAEPPRPRPAPVYLDSRELEQISTADPVYPAAAMRNRQEGWVTLEFTVTDSGTVRDPLVTDAEPSGVFDAAAITAVEQWRFRPRVANGRAVEVRTSVTLRFAVDR